MCIRDSYEYVQGVFLAKAIVSVVMSPRKPTFNVTAKGLTLDEDHLSELAWPFFAIYGLLFSAGLVAAYRYIFEPGVDNLMLVVGLWNLFNMMIAGAALGAVAERKQPDRHPRLNIAREGTLSVGGTNIRVRIKDVSAGGVSLVGSTELSALQFENGVTTGRLSIDPLGDIVKCETLPLLFVHQTGAGDQAVYGFEFSAMEPDEYYVLADLMYADSEALPTFLATRRKHKNVFAGSGRFIWWGLTEPIRAVSYLLKREKEKKEAAIPDAPSKTSLSWLRRFAASGKSPQPAPAEAGSQMKQSA